MMPAEKYGNGRWICYLASFVLLLTLAARLGFLHWSADLLALFHGAYLLLALALTFMAFALRRYLWAGVAGAALLINGGLLLPYLPLSAAPDVPRDLRVYVHNLYYRNDDLEGALADIVRHDPDLIFLMEYSDTMHAQLGPRFEDYPHQLIQPSRYTMGVALFSRIPLVDAQVERFATTRIPIVRASFVVEGQTVSFVGGHPWPPLAQWGALHRAQMADIARVAADAPHPLVVAGDFNASPWSFAVRQIEQAASLQDAQRGFGLRNTWSLSGVPLLPLDQVLVSSEWQVADFVHGERGGSDHAPLIVDLRLENPD